MKQIILIFLVIFIIGFILSLLEDLFNAMGGFGLLLFMAVLIGILIMAFSDRR
jgi:hypothetical protein